MHFKHWQALHNLVDGDSNVLESRPVDLFNDWLNIWTSLHSRWKPNTVSTSLGWENQFFLKPSLNKASNETCFQNIFQHMNFPKKIQKKWYDSSNTFREESPVCLRGLVRPSVCRSCPVCPSSPPAPPPSQAQNWPEQKSSFVGEIFTGVCFLMQKKKILLSKFEEVTVRKLGCLENTFRFVYRGTPSLPSHFPQFVEN